MEVELWQHEAHLNVYVTTYICYAIKFVLLQGMYKSIVQLTGGICIFIMLLLTENVKYQKDNAIRS